MNTIYLLKSDKESVRDIFKHPVPFKSIINEARFFFSSYCPNFDLR